MQGCVQKGWSPGGVECRGAYIRGGAREGLSVGLHTETELLSSKFRVLSQSNDAIHIFKKKHVNPSSVR